MRVQVTSFSRGRDYLCLEVSNENVLSSIFNPEDEDGSSHQNIGRF